MPCLDCDIMGYFIICVGTITSICFYLAPAVPFYKILKNKLNYHDFPWVLLLISFMNCILWTDYGLLNDFILLFFSNAIGANLTLSFLTIYLILVTGLNLYLSLSIAIGLSIIIVFITCLFYYVIDICAVKIFAAIFTILMYASLGVKIPQVKKTRNYKLIPIFSTIGGIVNSFCWLIYGILDKKWEFYVPNGIGLIFVIFFICLIYYLKRKFKPIDLSKKLAQFE